MKDPQYPFANKALSTTRRAFLGLLPAMVAGLRCAVAAPTPLIRVEASSAKQINGVACAADGRIFVSLPRWVDTDTCSVAVRQADGSLSPHPGGSWHTWRKGMDPASAFVCVNAIHINPAEPDYLWIVDAAAPAFGKVVPGGPKLVCVSISQNKIIRSYPLGVDVVPPNGYLNDVRFAHGHAFLTESGTGAILTLDLASGSARRLLAEHPSTKAIPGRVPIVDTRRLSTPSGKAPTINVDGIELSPDRESLLYAVPFGGWLWRVPIQKLLDEGLTAHGLSSSVERLGPLMPIGGMSAAPGGGLLLADVEHHRIVYRAPNGSLMPLVSSSLLQWPDASALNASGALLVAVSQVNHMPSFNGGVNSLARPFHIVKFHIVKIALPAGLRGGPQD